MTLMRIFVKVDDKGKIPIPQNIRREVGLKESQLVEIRVVGGSRKKNLVISKRENAR